MNKSELISRLSREAQLSVRDARAALEALSKVQQGLGGISGPSDRSHDVTIAGFGTFEIQAGLGERFHALAARWKSERGVSSSLVQMTMHPAYQQIIGMGPRALPFIFAELEREPDHWFWALTAITGENPVPEARRGKLPQMVRAWLRWARKHGHRGRGKFAPAPGAALVRPSGKRIHIAKGRVAPKRTNRSHARSANSSR